MSKLAVVLGLVVLFVTACSGDEDRRPNPPLQPTPEATAAAGSALTAAVSAVQGADCTQPGGGLPPPNRPCVSPANVVIRLQTPAKEPYFAIDQDYRRGLALFKVDFAGEDRDVFALFGRNQGGTWQPVGAFAWVPVGTPTNALPIPGRLPWDTIACSRQPGTRTVVLTEIGGVVRDGVVRGGEMKAEEFVLMSPGSLDVGGPLGYGYFRVSSPVVGWVDSRDIEVVSQPRCS
jgi:hypothetical protein